MDIEHIKLAQSRRSEIKAQMDSLKAQDQEIVDWLDQELIVNKLTNKVQKFVEGDVTVKATVPQNFTVNNDAFDQILTDNPEFQELAGQLFRWKLEVNEGNWNKATDDLKAVFAKAVTIKPGKTKYEINF